MRPYRQKDHLPDQIRDCSVSKALLSLGGLLTEINLEFTIFRGRIVSTILILYYGHTGSLILTEIYIRSKQLYGSKGDMES